MRQPWIRIIAATIFLMAQMIDVAASDSSCGKEKPAPCNLACCAGQLCDCNMTPAQAPAKPVPVAPVQQHQDLKFTPAVIEVLQLPYVALAAQELTPSSAYDAFLPHRPSPLVLHCALLI